MGISLSSVPLSCSLFPSLSLFLPPSPPLSLSHLSTCYATLLCHAASAAQVCGHVGTRKRTPPSQRLHLSTFLFLLSQPTHALPLSLSLSLCILLDSFPQEVSSSFPFLLFSSSPFPSPRVKNSLSRFPLTSPLILPLSRSGNRENGAIGAWAARALLVPLPGGASVDLPLPVHLCRSILSRPVARACGQGAPLPTIATLLFTTPYDSLAQMTRATLCNIYVCVWIGTKMRCTFMHV